MNNITFTYTGQPNLIDPNLKHVIIPLRLVQHLISTLTDDQRAIINHAALCHDDFFIVANVVTPD